MQRPVVLLGDSAAFAIDSTVGSPPPPPPPPKKHGETLVCDVCSKMFASQKTLKRHRETVHRQSGGFSRRVCDQRFYRRDHLKKHHIRKHANEEYEAPASYPCPICQKRFHYLRHFREHLKTHPTTTANISSQPIAATTLYFPRRATSVSG